ncbi:MAG: BON domain-containing protein [Candidatus Abyssubacteria bacterium]|nr:BON domain-containing protein [Candidatus Abyssubacteria bacterium]
MFKPLESTAAEEIAAGMSGVKEVKNEIICCRM